jgi:hypothetical protein
MWKTAKGSMKDVPNATPRPTPASACVAVGGGVVVCTENPFLSGGLALFLHAMLRVIRRASLKQGLGTRLCVGGYALSKDLERVGDAAGTDIVERASGPSNTIAGGRPNSKNRSTSWQIKAPSS